MIISKFNKYVEKHGRTTYIVLGIIICFAFVIFVTPDGAGFGGCGGPGRISSVAKMYGKKIKLDDFLLMKRMTDIDCYIRYNMLLSQYSEDMLNRETLNRFKLLHEAKKRGFLKKITDADIAKEIQSYPWLQDENKKFSMEAFNGFKNNFLKSYQLTAGDFDTMVRDNLAIKMLTEDVMSSAQVTDAEVDSQVAEYKVAFSEFDMQIDKDSAPSEQEIKNFFDNRKADVPVEKNRDALVAYFSIDEITAAASGQNASEELKKSTTVTEDEIRKQYDSAKDRLYKDKTFESVKGMISTTLRTNKIRTYTRAKAVELRNNIANAIKDADEATALEKFRELAANAKAKVIASGMISTGNAIAGMPGAEHPQLANAIRTLGKKGELYGNVIMDGRNFATAMLQDIQPGAVPENLDDATSKKIADVIISEKALDFYKANIEPYKALAKGTRSTWELGRNFLEELRNDKSLSMEEQQAKWTEYNQFLSEVVAPFYRQEQRSFTVAAFDPADYEKGVVLSEADIEKGYEERKAEFRKVEVKLAQILIKASAEDSDDVKNARKAKADEVYAKLLQGEDFTKLAGEYSEDEDTKANGGVTELTDVATLDAAVREQVSKMAVNQLSPVIGTAKGHLIFKLLEKTEPKAIADVKDQLVQALTKEAAKTAALEDAEKLYQAVAVAWNEAEHKSDARQATFKNCANGTGAKLSDVALTTQNNYMGQGAAGDYKLLEAVFSASADEPFTAAVSGTDAAYVACLNEVKEAFIDDAAERMTTLTSVYKRRIANDSLKLRATAVAEQANTALKAGTELNKAVENVAFKAAKDSLSRKTSSQFTDFNVRNPAALLDELDKAALNTVTAPQQTYSGYVLVCLTEKILPSGEEAVTARENARNQLLDAKKQQLFSKFLQETESEANITDLHPAIFGRQ